MMSCIKLKMFFNKHNYGPFIIIKDSTNVEEGGVHCKKYNGHCTQNNKLKFQKRSKHHPLHDKSSHVEHPLTRHFL